MKSGSRQPNRTRFFLATAILIFALFFGLSVTRLVTIEQDVAADFGENLVLSMAQNEKAVLAFLDDLNRYGRGEADVGKEDLSQRFDLLWSRVSVVRTGELAERLGNVRDGLETIVRTRLVLQQIEPLVEALAPGDLAGAREIDRQLRPLLPELARATFASSYADLVRLDARGEARRQAILGSIVTMLGMVVSVAILIALLLRELWQHRRLADVALAAEAAARASEQRAMDGQKLIRGIIDAVPGLINVKDHEGRYVLMNAYQGRVYGVAPDAAVGRTSADYTGAEYGGGSRRLDLEVIRTGRRQSFHERPFVEPSGRKRIWWTAKAPLFGDDGGVRYVVTVALDITLLKAAEAARRNLSRYFSPNIVEMLAARDQSAATEAHNATVAVLFADLCDFTRIASQSPPETVLALLRDFHVRMTDVVLGHNGTLEKYLGDGLMATFGTPVTTERDATNALFAAERMVQAVREWNLERRAAGRPPVRMGVGIHFGRVVLGEIGTHERAEYAVVGDTVNLASRLQQLTRGLDAAIAISAHFATTVAAENAGGDRLLSQFTAAVPQVIDGYDLPVQVRLLPSAAVDQACDDAPAVG